MRLLREQIEELKLILADVVGTYSPQLIIHFATAFLSTLTLFYYVHLSMSMCLYSLAVKLVISGAIDILILHILTSVFQSIFDTLDEMEALMISQASEVTAAKELVNLIWLYKSQILKHFCIG